MNNTKQDKTWEDLKEIVGSEELCIRESAGYAADGTTSLGNEISHALDTKVYAMLRLAHLMNRCYGGIITPDEKLQIMNEGKSFYTVAPNDKGEIVVGCRKSPFGGNFICFHTKEQAYDFMSHPSNVKLAEEFYTI